MGVEIFRESQYFVRVHARKSTYTKENIEHVTRATFYLRDH